MDVGAVRGNECGLGEEQENQCREDEPVQVIKGRQRRQIGVAKEIGGREAHQHGQQAD